MRFHLTRNILPSVNQTGHNQLATNDKKPEAIEVASPNKKRRRSEAGGANSVLTRELKRVYKEVISTAGLQLELLNRFITLIQRVPLDDQQILLLSNGVLSSLELDSPGVAMVQQLQTECIAVISATFARYPVHRETIVEDLFPIMLRLPTGKRSLRTFPLRYSSASSSQNLATLNHNVVRSLLFKDMDQSQPHSIQMITAMVLSMIHSCVQLPVFTRVPNASPSGAEGELKPTSTYTSGRSQCQEVSDSFVAHLLRRCLRNKGGSSEFRPVLTNFVEDLLLLLLNTDFPAAEMLLTSFARRLSSDLSHASPTFSKVGSPGPSPDATYVNTAFDALAKICATQSRILATQRDRCIAITNSEDLESNGKKNEFACYCGKDPSKGDVFGCDQCGKGYHSVCVGMDADSPPETWYCDACRLMQVADRVRRRHQADGEQELVDEEFVFHHAQQTSVSQRLFAAEMARVSQFHLAGWIDQLERKSRDSSGNGSQPSRIVNELMESWSSPGPAGEALTEEGRIRAALYLVAKTTGLLLSFRQQITFLIKLMGDEKSPALRKLSLKAIEKVRLDC